jgi:eukaryotic-like serine/threonine-protein kinase
MSANLSSIFPEFNLNVVKDEKKTSYAFEDYRLDAARLMLYRGEEEIALPPKAVETLLALIESQGAIVSKDELMNRLWADTVVDESNLTHYLYILRKTLNETKDGKPFIETLRRRGYRFNGEVRQIETLPQTNGTATAAKNGDEPRYEVRRQGNVLKLVSLREEAENPSKTGAANDSQPEQKSAGKTALIAATVFVALLAIGGIVFAVYKFWGKSDKSLQAIKIERLTTNGKSTDAVISPDGKYVVYVLDEGGQRSLWTRQVATTSNVQIIPPADVQYWGLNFTPDGNYINFVRQEKADVPPALYQMPAPAGAEKKLISDVHGAVSYSPDGRQFAFVRLRFPTPNESSLLIANADGTGERILAAIQRPEMFPTAYGRHPVWSPDGKTIACIAFDSRSANGWKVVEVAVADGEVKPTAVNGWNGIRRIAWLPDKSGLLVLGADKMSAAAQIWRISYPDGEAQRITTDFNNYFGMTLTADSDTLVSAQSVRLSNLWVAPNGDASRAAQIKSGGSNLEGIDALAWTPDGRIVYYSRASGTHDLWIMNADGSSQKQITVEAAGANFGATVTPDGRYIVFDSERGEKRNIWRMDLDGGNPKQLTSGNRDFRPTVSPDSQTVVYASQSSGDYRLWKVSIDGGDAVQLTDYLSNIPKISPDGKFIVCQYRADGNSLWRYAIVPIEGGKPVRVFDLPGGTDDFRWSKDSRSIIYQDTRGGVGNLWSFPLDEAPPKQLTNFKTELIYNFEWSADGKQLVLARGTTTSDIVLISNFK